MPALWFLALVFCFRFACVLYTATDRSSYLGLSDAGGPQDFVPRCSRLYILLRVAAGEDAVTRASDGVSEDQAVSVGASVCSKLYIYVYIQQKLRRFFAVVGGLEIKKNAHPQTINAATATGAMHTHGYHPKQTPDS